MTHLLRVFFHTRTAVFFLSVLLLRFLTRRSLQPR